MSEACGCWDYSVYLLWVHLLALSSLHSLWFFRNSRASRVLLWAPFSPCSLREIFLLCLLARERAHCTSLEHECQLEIQMDLPVCIRPKRVNQPMLEIQKIKSNVLAWSLFLPDREKKSHNSSLPYSEPREGLGAKIHLISHPPLPPTEVLLTTFFISQLFPCLIC